MRKFEQKVEELRAIHRQLAAPPKFNDARDEKLTSRAYLAEALYNGKTTVDKLKKLDKLLLSRPPEERPAISGFLDGARRVIIATRVDQGCALRPPAGGLHTLVPSRDLVTVLVEAMQFGTTALELMALAVWRATRERPEVFGVIERWDEHQ